MRLAIIVSPDQLRMSPKLPLPTLALAQLVITALSELSTLYLAPQVPTLHPQRRLQAQLASLALLALIALKRALKSPMEIAKLDTTALQDQRLLDLLLLTVLQANTAQKGLLLLRIALPESILLRILLSPAKLAQRATIVWLELQTGL